MALDRRRPFQNTPRRFVPLFLAEGRRDVIRLTQTLDRCETERWLLTHPESRHLRRVGAVYAHLARTLEMP